MMDKTCAIIVSFHPPSGLVCSIQKLRPQVQALVVVDNGSRDLELQPLLDRRQDLHFELIQNGRNIGLAAALNVGVRWALDRGFDWIVLFDQDSAVSGVYVSAMLETCNAHPHRRAIGIVGPTYEDRHTGHRARPRLLAEDGGPVEVMTSGSMIPSDVFRTCGLFREDFVIDEVDHEFCFRVREKNFVVLQCEAAVLLHQPGNPKRISLFGRTLIHATQHSAPRRYYMARNGIVLVKKYWRKYPKWAYETLRDIADSVLIICIAEDDKPNKVRHVFRGIRDAFRGSMGEVVKL